MSDVAVASVSHPDALVVRTTAIDDPGPLLDLTDDPDLLAWVRGDADRPAGPDGLVAWGTAVRLDVDGPDRFDVAATWWQEMVSAAAVRDEVRMPGSGPVCFGSFGFTDDDGGLLRVPEVVVGRRDGVCWVTTIGTGGLQSIPAPTPVPPPDDAGQVRFSDGALTPADWGATVADAVARINAGALDKVVLAMDRYAETERPLDSRYLVRRLAESYPRCWTYAVDGLIGATPEMLVRSENGLITSRVLAGTIRRTGDDAGDLALAGRLARSSKDLEEHEYAVRSVAEALAPYCGSMNVPEAPFVLHLPNVMHLASDVTAVASVAVGNSAAGEHESSLRLAAALHPSAAVCGTPTDVARDLIAELERMERGRYAGPVGWMDGTGDGEWGIALRCGMHDPADPHRFRMYAGCGIVAGSVPEAEIAEADAKFVPVRDALQPPL